MRMTDEQLHRLGEVDPTVIMCYHGLRLIHECPEMGSGEIPIFTIRLVGHLLNGVDDMDDPSSDMVVPDHKVFSIDLPFHGPTLATLTESLAEITAQAFLCDTMNQANGLGDKLRGILGGLSPERMGFQEVKPEDVPDFLKRLFGDDGNDGKGKGFPWM